MFNVPLQRQSRKTQALYQRYSKGIQKAGIACFSLEDAPRRYSLRAPHNAWALSGTPLRREAGDNKSGIFDIFSTEKFADFDMF